jgi:hypothetical protein
MFLKYDIDQKTISNVTHCLSRNTQFINAEYYFAICFCIMLVKENLPSNICIRFVYILYDPHEKNCDHQISMIQSRNR